MQTEWEESKARVSWQPWFARTWKRTKTFAHRLQFRQSILGAEQVMVKAPGNALYQQASQNDIQMYPQLGAHVQEFCDRLRVLWAIVVPLYVAGECVLESLGVSRELAQTTIIIWISANKHKHSVLAGTIHAYVYENEYLVWVLRTTFPKFKHNHNSHKRSQNLKFSPPGGGPFVKLHVTCHRYE